MQSKCTDVVLHKYRCENVKEKSLTIRKQTLQNAIISVRLQVLIICQGVMVCSNKKKTKQLFLSPKLHIRQTHPYTLLYEERMSFIVYTENKIS